MTSEVQTQSLPDALPTEVIAALERNNKIEAIKLLRVAMGIGLKEAKDIVDQYQPGQPLTLPASSSAPASPSLIPMDNGTIEAALKRRNKIAAIKLFRQQTGLGLLEAKKAIEALVESRSPNNSSLAPGEVRQSARTLNWMIGIGLVAAVVAYFFFKTSGWHPWCGARLDYLKPPNPE